MLAGSTVYLRKGTAKALSLFRPVTEAEVRAIRNGDKVLYHLNGRTHNLTITSIKTWKTRHDVEIRVKYGLTEFFAMTLKEAMEYLVVEL